MTCREFINRIEGFPLAELRSSDTEMLAHQVDCVSCASLLQERNALAGAMQVLRTRTAQLEAPSMVEHNVLRAFRQDSATRTAMMRDPSAFRWSDFFGWRIYAAVAAVLAISLGLGLWFAQHSDKAAPQPTATVQQPAPPSVAPVQDTTPPVQASASDPALSHSAAKAGSAEPTALTTASLTQSEQAQGYTPLMLCDPISCSEDAQVVRMELPVTATDGSAVTQMADVIVGDDGLVRAIRIVQQQ